MKRKSDSEAVKTDSRLRDEGVPLGMQRAIAVLILLMFFAVKSYGQTWINVTAYGAKGDGVTDDSAAVQNALNDCSKGRTVFFPAGTYAVVNTVEVLTGCHLVGEGAGITEQKGSAMTGSNIKASAINGQIFPPNAPVIEFHNTTHASLDGLSIDCSGVTGPIIGLQYDSNNNPPSSFNSFKHFTATGCHMAFVNGMIGSPGNPPPGPPANCTVDNSCQADTFELDDYIFLGNCNDTTGEAIRVNSANAGQGSVIGRGNIQCYNVGHHIVSTNGMLWIQHNNGGSPVAPPSPTGGPGTSAFFKIEPSVAGSVNLLDVEVEGGWTFAGLDHGCNTSTQSVSSWIGNAWNGHPIVVDGCDNIYSASNQSNNSTVIGAKALVTSINESGWATSAPATPANLGHLIGGAANFGDTVISQNVVVARGSGSGCTSFPTLIKAGDLQACEDQHAGQLFIGSDVALLGNGDGTITTGAPWLFNHPALFSQPKQPMTVGATGQAICQGNGTTGTLQCSYNGGTFFSQTQTIGKGEVALGTGTIAANTCAPLVFSAAGVRVNDVISWSYSTDPSQVAGYDPRSPGALSISAFPAQDQVTFSVCNSTSASINPGAVTLNWIVTR
jgi:hypothetical protein